MAAQESHPESYDLKLRISRIDRLPPMPVVVQRLIELLGEEDTDADELGRVIESDQALASKILNLANSAYYGFANNINTVNHAVVAIGFQELQVLAIGSGLAGVFHFQDAPGIFRGDDLWLHCLAVSWTARELALSAGYPEPGEMLVSGLLHDIGKLVLASFLRPEFAKVIDLVKKGGAYHLAESEVGVAHTEVGYLLARQWGLPRLHQAVIRNHHGPPADDPHVQAACLVAIADGLVKSLRMGLVCHSPSVDTDFVIKASGLSTADIRKVTVKARETLPVMMRNWAPMLLAETG